MNNKLIVILGPTAVGKSDLSIEIARYFDAPIVSSDSRQVFRQMSIGTAVPTSEQLNSVPHHFIHTKDISEPFTAGMFEREALELLDTLYKQGQYVLLTGGSGLYIDALCCGIDAIPAANNEIRDDIEQQYKQFGIDHLAMMLQRLDPQFYNEVDRSNPKRMLRALEVCLTTGAPYSSLRTGQTKERNFDVVKIGLTLDRELLYDRINRRVDQMIEQGLEQEARELHPMKGCNALETVGYKEFFGYFDGKMTYADAIELLKRNTRRYAKRQMTWFRRSTDVKWFSPQDVDSIIEHIKTR